MPSWSDCSCLKRATRRCIQCAKTFGSVMPLAEGFDGSASACAGVFAAALWPGGRSLWHPAQSDESGRSPPSCQWQLKQEAWLVGDSFSIPFFNQNASVFRSFKGSSPGGFVTYSSFELPCGSYVL